VLKQEPRGCHLQQGAFFLSQRGRNGVPRHGTREEGGLEMDSQPSANLCESDTRQLPPGPAMSCRGREL
jgi:hypothetical protein